MEFEQTVPKCFEPLGLRPVETFESIVPPKIDQSNPQAALGAGFPPPPSVGFAMQCVGKRTIARQVCLAPNAHSFLTWTSEALNFR